MIKCDEKQCVLYSKDGSKVLGKFPFSEHDGEEGAKKAAMKREKQVQYFKRMKSAVDEFGLPTVAKYIMDKAADCEACQELLKTYVEKAEETEAYICPECGYKGKMKRAAAEEKSADVGEKELIEKTSKAAKTWESLGGSIDSCIARVKGKVNNPGAFCASLKDAVKGKGWRKEKRKSFDETLEEALEMLQKDEPELQDIDLSELERWLQNEADEGGEETAPPTEAETTAEPEPEPEGVAVDSQDLPHDFHSFLLRNHAIRRAGVVNVLEDGQGFTDYMHSLAGEEVEHGQDD